MTLNQALKEEAPAGATEAGGIPGIAPRFPGGPVRRRFPTGVINIATPIKKRKKKRKKKKKGTLHLSNVVKGTASVGEGVSIGSDKAANVRTKGSEEFLAGTRTRQKKKPSEISGKERRKIKSKKGNYRTWLHGNVGDYNKYI